jgi:hypothetical protein
MKNQKNKKNIDSRYPNFDSDTYSDVDADSNSNSESSPTSYEKTLIYSMKMLNSKTTKSNKYSNRSSESKPTESRVEFIKHILDGNKLQPMIDFDCNNMESDCKRLIKKTMDVRELFKSLNVSLKYIKSGTTRHTFKATSKEDENVAFAIKVCAYPKTDDYGNIGNPKRPENAEIRMLKLLSSFVLKMKTPHFILPIGTFNTSIKPFITVSPKLIDLSNEKNKSYREFIEKCENDEFEDLVSVLISEWANGGDLLDYIRRNYKNISLTEWTVIIFQILYTLASLHKKYESFRHNDMKANNILVRFTDNNFTEKLYKYKMDDIIFQIPNVGIQIKIWDFDFACIDGVIENNKVNADWTKKMNVSKERNQYYDMHFFFNTLICEKYFPQFYTGGAPREIIEFVHRIIPEKYRTIVKNKYIRKGGRILIDTEYTTPYKVIMKDELFRKYRCKCTDKK